MNTVERVKQTCKEKGISLHKLEMDLGYANGYIGQLRKGSLPGDRLAEIAKYLNVSQNYLLTGEEKPEHPIYYFNDETARMAQELFNDPTLHALFDMAKDAEPEDVKAVTGILETLKNRGRGNDDTGC